MESETNIKPCPFCGEQEEIVVMNSPPNLYVKCAFCGAKSKPYFIKEKAITAWNTRTSKADELLKELLGVIKDLEVPVNIWERMTIDKLEKMKKTYEQARSYLTNNTKGK